MASRYPAGVSALLVPALLIAGCASRLTLAGPDETQPSSGEPSASVPTASALERQMHDLVNRHRASRGHASLRWDDRVAAMAREHSQAMASGRRSFSHQGFEDRAARIRALLPVRSIAENVAYDSRSGPELPHQVVEGWIASPGHRQNIEGVFTVTGIGAAVADDGIRYFTQIFVQTGE